MNLVMISKELTTMDISQMKTSSQKFQYSFGQNFSCYSSFKVVILSLSLEWGEILNDEKSHLKVVGIRGTNIKETIIFLKRFLREVNSRDTILLNYGYDLIDNIVLTILQKQLKFKRVAFIFDSHYGATENFNGFKYIISEIYFKSSLLLSKRINAFLLFNQHAVRELKITKPYLITRPGVELNDRVESRYSRNHEQFIILYTGTLIEYNGILELLQGFSKIKNRNFRLRIFGSGPLKDAVMKYSEKDKRIYYGGLVESGQLEKEYNESDLLINFRKTDHIVAKYSFPSKLVEYISKKKPVLSTNLDFNLNIKKGIYIINNLEPEFIKNKIEEIALENVQTKNQKINIAYQNLSKEFNWEKVILEIDLFLKEVFVED